jgi:hypothetical protein
VGIGVGATVGFAEGPGVSLQTKPLGCSVLGAYVGAIVGSSDTGFCKFGAGISTDGDKVGIGVGATVGFDEGPGVSLQTKEVGCSVSGNAVGCSVGSGP